MDSLSYAIGLAEEGSIVRYGFESKDKAQVACRALQLDWMRALFHLMIDQSRLEYKIAVYKHYGYNKTPSRWGVLNRIIDLTHPNGKINNAFHWFLL